MRLPSTRGLPFKFIGHIIDAQTRHSLVMCLSHLRSSRAREVLNELRTLSLSVA